MNSFRLATSSAGSTENSHRRVIDSMANFYDSVKKIISARVEGYKAEAKARKDTNHVLQMDDEMLKDIGLTHSDRDSLQAGLTSLTELNKQREIYRSRFNQVVR